MQDFSAFAPVLLDDPAHYLVQDPEQLQYLLGQLAKHPEIVCLYPAARREPFALSALLEIAEDHLIFDASPDAQTQKQLLAAPYLLCVSSLARVPVQFEATQPQAILHDGYNAIRTQRPDHLYYMQRRDFFRLSVPTRQPVHCRIKDGEIGFIEAMIADISIGGVSLVGPLPSLILSPGMRMEGCQIELPEEGVLQVDLLVCTLRDIGLRTGRRNLRIGCRFLQLSGHNQTLLQRYVNRVERNRIAHG